MNGQAGGEGDSHQPWSESAESGQWGMRGVVTLLMLEELEKMSGAKTHQMFDMVVGTSTGALIASMGVREGLEVYREMGRKIFKSECGRLP